ncbi:MAG: hypothetical protein NVS9B12_08260 [Vulcanimicrobiaceae bacterium]
MVIEGTDRTLADLALNALLERLLPDESMRDLNLERFRAAELDGMAKVADALGAMPFLADRRVVVVTETHALRVAPRRELWSVAQNVPEGNTLILSDLLALRSQRPEPFGALAGRAALRIDTTLNQATRMRYVQELLQALDAAAEPRVVAELAGSEAELSAIKNDLEKLSLLKKKITYQDLEADSLSVQDPKAYKYASALVEGRGAEALEIAAELFQNDPRGAGVPLVSALATEFGLLWEMARPGGELPSRFKWRERALRPLAARVGERKARVAYERALRGFEAIVTGKIEEPRVLVEMLTAELSKL